MSEIINEADIRTFLTILHADSECFEIRILDINNKVMTGFFDNIEDVFKSIPILNKDPKCHGIYVTLNSVDKRLLGRAYNKMILSKKNLSTNDPHITKRNFILIDRDANDNISGVNSTNAQKEDCYNRIVEIKEFLESENIIIKIFADSGNGYHLYLPVNLENSEENLLLIGNILNGLSEYFQDKEIDVKVSNASRITKLIGTFTRKGDNTPEQPQRLSKLIEVNPTNEINTLDQLKLLVAKLPLPKEEERVKPIVNSTNKNHSFNLEDFLRDNGINYEFNKVTNGWSYYTIEKCPFDNNHGSNGEVAVCTDNNGQFGFTCAHNTCNDKHWYDFRNYFEPGYREKAEAEYQERKNDNFIDKTEKLLNIEKYDSIDEALDSIKTTILKMWGNTPVEKNNSLCIDLIAKTIINNDYFVTIKNTKLNYHYENGYYVLGADSVIEEYAERVLGENCNNKAVNELLGKIQRLTYKDETIFDIDPSLICVENGILNVITKELIPHSPDYYFLQKIPIIYDPHKQCPIFQDYLKGVIPETNREKERKTLIQFLGYSLYRDYPIAQFLILNGFGRNGKGVYLELCSRFVGNNVSNLGIEELQDKDASSEMLGKLLNAAGEIGEVKVKQMKLLKGITGRDRQRIRFLYKGGFSAKIYAKFLFANNQLPMFKDRDNAIFERLLLIEFNETFSADNEKTNPNLINDLTEPNEMSGILNLALEGLEELLKDKHFACFTNIDENRDRLAPKFNPIEKWYKESTELDLYASTLGATLFSAYKIYTLEMNSPTGSIPEFYSEILRLGGDSINKKKVSAGQMFEGIKLKNTPTPKHTGQIAYS